MTDKPQTGEVFVYGPVDGTGSLNSAGAYVKLKVWVRHAFFVEFITSRANAEMLAVELKQVTKREAFASQTPTPRDNKHIKEN